MQYEHTTTSRHTGEKVFSRNKKGMGGWLDTGCFFISLAALCILICSFRFPSTGESGSIRLTRNLNIPRSHSEGETELRILERGARGDYPAAEHFDAPSGVGDFDLDKLARAVAKHETADGTKGVGATHNNHHGLKENGEFIRFDSRAASYHSFKLNWIKHYFGRFPTMDDAVKYSGNDRAADWLRNVIYFYESN